MQGSFRVDREDMLPPPRFASRERSPMSLAFNFEEIAPRQLRPEVLELEGISRASVEAWRSDLKATGMAGRGWAWTAFDWDENRLFNYIGDAQNAFPVWNATPLVALDVYEHAYFLDFQTDRASYIEAFFDNLDWDVVNGWVEQYGIPA